LVLALPAVHARIRQCVRETNDERLAAAGARAVAAIEHVQRWVREHGDAVQVQSHARRIAMTIGRALELALLIEHARWELESGNGRATPAAAARFAAAPVDLLVDIDAQDSRLLV
jgi:acyl-CoA dehydrogenase